MSIIKNIFNKTSLYLLVLLLLLASPLGVSADTVKTPNTFNYLALGDSLAAGQTPYLSLTGKGYADFLAEKLTAAGCIGTYQKRYAVSGYTTDNVLADIENNVKRDLSGNPDTVGIRNNIASADIITVNVGANDLLKKIYINPTTGVITYDPTVINNAIYQLSINFSTIISEIRTINPSAKIYIMGYYNALPQLPQASQQILIQSLISINTILEQTALQANATYVPTFDAIAQSPTSYLPNPQDIHPNEEGYSLMADLLWKEVRLNLPTLYFEPPTGILTEGSTAELSLSVKNIANLYGADLQLSFNPSVIQVVYEELTVGETVYGLTVAPETYCNNTNGKINIVSSRRGDVNAQGFTGNGKILSIVFQCISKGNANISIEKAVLSDDNAQPIGYVIEPFTLESPQNISVSGQVYLQGVAKFAGGVEVQLVEQLARKVVARTTTPPSGQYLLDKDNNGQPIPVGTYSIILSKPVYLTQSSNIAASSLGDYAVPNITLLTGDIDLDNKIKFGDLVNLSGIYGKTFNCTDQNNWQPYADLNRDNKVSLFDLVLLARNYNQEGSGIVTNEEINTKIAVISDLHYMAPELGSSGEAFEEYLATDRKLLAQSDAILNATIENIKTGDSNIVLITGDLTKDGEKICHEKVALFLEELENAGKKVYVIDGNHDINNPLAEKYEGANTIPVDFTTPEEFKTIYSDFGYGEAIAKDPNSLSYVVEPVNGLRIIAMDSCLYDTNITDNYPRTSGKFSVERLDWIKAQLNAAKTQGKTVIGMTHHGIIKHFSTEDIIFGEYLVENWDSISTQLADLGMNVVFTGHFHAQDIAKKETVNSFIYDIETGSLVTYPCPYRTVEISNGQLNITSNHIDSINYDTGSQTFPEYAKDFNAAGLHTLTPQFLAQLLIKQGVPKEQAIATGQSISSQELAPSFTMEDLIVNSMLAQYEGDETLNAQTLAIVNGLLASNNLFIKNIAGIVASLYTDTLPGDNNITISLETETTVPE